MEIYDFDLVARILPWRVQDYYFGHKSTCKIIVTKSYLLVITDNELKKMHLFDPESDLYKFDPDLLSYRKPGEPKRDSIPAYEDTPPPRHFSTFVDGTVGSNCWAISGELTESGKPLVACDPHLMKWIYSKWYFVKLEWGSDPANNYLVGGTIPGIPLVTYGRSATAAWGVTALNPDISDLYVE